MSDSIQKLNTNCTSVGGISKTIPAEFDNSISYLEILYKLTGKINEVIDFVNVVLENKLSEYIDQRFNDMMIDAMYDPATETLVLKLEDGEDDNA